MSPAQHSRSAPTTFLNAGSITASVRHPQRRRMHGQTRRHHFGDGRGRDDGWHVHPGERLVTFTRTSGTAGTVNLSGTLTNTGTTLTLDTLNNGFGTWNLGGGTLSGGTLVTTNSAVLQCVLPNTGTLNAVTIAANSDFIANFGHVTVTGGLTVNGRVTVSGDGNRGLYFTGTQTVDGTGEIKLAGDNLQLNQEGMTLTVGAELNH